MSKAPSPFVKMSPTELEDHISSHHGKGIKTLLRQQLDEMPFSTKLDVSKYQRSHVTSTIANIKKATPLKAFIVRTIGGIVWVIRIE